MTTPSEIKIWEEDAVDETVANAFSAPDALEDSFVIDGLDFGADDDFGSLLNLNASEAFNESFGPDQFSDRPSNKRVQKERSLSPPRKRRQTMSDGVDKAPSTVLSSMARSNSLPAPTDSINDLQEQYRNSLKQLALSMQRSEITRNEIIRQRKEAETRAKLRMAQSRSYQNADSFLNGSRSTLTVGLAQSRHMLRSIMRSMDKGMM